MGNSMREVHSEKAPGVGDVSTRFWRINRSSLNKWGTEGHSRQKKQYMKKQRDLKDHHVFTVEGA